MPKRFMRRAPARAGRARTRRPGLPTPTVPGLASPLPCGGTLQPPLPLQLFFPAQPLSPVLQPPMPLHSFLPLQSCLAAAVAQPPLPLHEFLPAQPLSPVLQPPWPLHALWPLQTCFGVLSSAANARGPPITFDPAARPAATAPIAFANSRRLMRSSSLPAGYLPQPALPPHLASEGHTRRRAEGRPEVGNGFRDRTPGGSGGSISRPSRSRSSPRRRPVGGRQGLGRVLEAVYVWGRDRPLPAAPLPAERLESPRRSAGRCVRRLPLLVAAALAWSVPARAEDAVTPPLRRGPAEIRDEHVLAQPRLTLPAVSPCTTPAGRWAFATSVLWSNSFSWDQDYPGEVARRSALPDRRRRPSLSTRPVRRGLREEPRRSPCASRSAGAAAARSTGSSTGGTASATSPTATGPTSFGTPSASRGSRRGRAVLLDRAATARASATSSSRRAGACVDEASRGGFARARWPRVAADRHGAVLRATVPAPGWPGRPRRPARRSFRPLRRRRLDRPGPGARARRRSTRPLRGHGFVAIEWRPWPRVSLVAETDAASRLVENIDRYPGSALDPERLGPHRPRRAHAPRPGLHREHQGPALDDRLRALRRRLAPP